MTAAERRLRIEEARARDTGVGVRCPRCLVHTPGLKPRKATWGSAASPSHSGPSGVINPAATSEGTRMRRGGKIFQYQCPVCEYAWSATPGAATDSS